MDSGTCDLACVDWDHMGIGGGVCYGFLQITTLFACHRDNNNNESLNASTEDVA